MTAVLIDGKAVAAQVRAEVARDVAAMASPPGLATVLVGEDPASAVYVASKRKQCAAAGMRDLHRHLPGDITAAELEKVLDELNDDPSVTGILLQLPLPKHLDASAMVARIHPDKDVDGLTVASAGRLVQGLPGLRPCTPAGVMVLLEHAGVALEGAEAVVVGRSQLVGKPMAQLLLAQNATVTTCHSRTRDLAEVCRRADVLVAAAGVRHMLGVDHVKPGATVIDVGIHRVDGKLSGDVDTGAVMQIAGAITPVPGGVGPMTIAMLLKNAATAAGL